MPPRPLPTLIAIAFATFLLALLHLGLISLAFDKLGVSPQLGILLLLCALLGSGINIPLFTVTSTPQPTPLAFQRLYRQLFHRPLPQFNGKTQISLNVGGGLLPCLFSFYLFAQHPQLIIDVLISTVIITFIAYHSSRPIAGVGIAMPIFIAPLCAAILALLINPEFSAPLAFMSGTLGVLIGADLLRLRDIGNIGTPVAAIGGAGTFDGIFLSGVFAALLA